ncbi:MAG: hypothetical protein AABW67_01030 [Nanoarchaeota archaeon]
MAIKSKLEEIKGNLDLFLEKFFNSNSKNVKEILRYFSEEYYFGERNWHNIYTMPPSAYDMALFYDGAYNKTNERRIIESLDKNNNDKSFIPYFGNFIGTELRKKIKSLEGIDIDILGSRRNNIVEECSCGRKHDTSPSESSESRYSFFTSKEEDKYPEDWEEITNKGYIPIIINKDRKYPFSLSFDINSSSKNSKPVGLKDLNEFRKISSNVSITNSPWHFWKNYRGLNPHCSGDDFESSNPKFATLQRITLKFDKEKYMNLLEMLSRDKNGEEKLQIIYDKINLFLED